MTAIAQYGVIIVLSAFLILHFLILLKIIPYNIVWAGRLKSDKEMYRFEIASIIVNAFFLLFIMVYSNIFAFNFPKVILTTILWIMVALFAFNTLGNIVSKNKLERKLFMPITFLLTIFSLILALTN